MRKRRRRRGRGGGQRFAQWRAIYARLEAFTASGAYLLLKLDAKCSALVDAYLDAEAEGALLSGRCSSALGGARRRREACCSSISVWLQSCLTSCRADELEAESACVRRRTGFLARLCGAGATQQQFDLEAGGGSEEGGEVAGGKEEKMSSDQLQDLKMVLGPLRELLLKKLRTS